jgi:hypothetical protein
VFELIVTVDVVSSSLILLALIMKAIRSFETSVLTGATWRRIPEDGIRHVRKPCRVSVVGTEHKNL